MVLLCGSQWYQSRPRLRIMSLIGWVFYLFSPGVTGAHSTILPGNMIWYLEWQADRPANMKVRRRFNLESKLSSSLTFVPRYVSCQISGLPGLGIILSLNYLAPCNSLVWWPESTKDGIDLRAVDEIQLAIIMLCLAPSQSTMFFTVDLQVPAYAPQ